jgi:cytochrome c1
MEVLIWFGLVAFLMWVAHEMAVVRERSPGAWVIATFFFGLFALLALLVVGDHPSKRYNR